MERMKMIIFDGKAYAKKIEGDLIKSGKLVGKKLLIVSSDPENPYVRLKREFGERCGVIVEVTPPEPPLKLRGGWGSYDGVLIQLPVKDKKILESIPLDKDIDGLRAAVRGQQSAVRFLPAAVVAVEKILQEAEKSGSLLF
jgi:5,10-methylene-tetrahydrofolate dehydrogenase/methenyl tetrahydrofolate cyclohydrolase